MRRIPSIIYIPMMGICSLIMLWSAGTMVYLGQAGVVAANQKWNPVFFIGIAAMVVALCVIGFDRSAPKFTRKRHERLVTKTIRYALGSTAIVSPALTKNTPLRELRSGQWGWVRSADIATNSAQRGADAHITHLIGLSASVCPRPHRPSGAETILVYCGQDGAWSPLHCFVFWHLVGAMPSQQATHPQMRAIIHHLGGTLPEWARK